MLQSALRRRSLGLLSQRGAPAAAFGSKGGSISVDLSKAFDTHSEYCTGLVGLVGVVGWMNRTGLR